MQKELEPIDLQPSALPSALNESETVEKFPETAPAIPLDQVLNSINQDSVVEPIEYIKTFLVPGGGE